MILSYLLRLLCLCLASFFLLNAFGVLLVRAFAGRVLHFAETQPAALAARFLLILRLLPSALAMLFVVLLGVPSYVRLEPSVASEQVGVVCILLGILGLATWWGAILRAMRALYLSIHHNRCFVAAARETPAPAHSPRMLVIEGDRPVLALSGLLRPRLLLSSSLLRALSPDELRAALAHEHAHRASRDNWKRLLFLLAPDALPFRNPLYVIEQRWAKFTEWAADDRAVAGDSQRALSLASALLRVARLGANPPLPYLSTSLLAGGHDLRARVDRLLQPAIPALSSRSQTRHRLLAISLLSVGVLTALLAAPAALHFVHELQELLLR